MSEPVEAHDGRRFAYCPQLGGPVTFRHCRTQGTDQVCARIVRCWQKQFDVARFLAGHLSAEALRGLAARTREDKLPTLAKLVRESVEQRGAGRKGA